MYNVYGLGNALVDEIYSVDDGFLHTQQVAKGHMTLVEEDQFDSLIGALDGVPPNRSSGGSAANTITAVQAYGGQTFYSCKVAEDVAGSHFLEELGGFGVHLNANAAADTGKSGRCLVLVTEDAERSMLTFLGVSMALSPAEIDTKALADADYYYVEGYLSSSETGLAAAIRCRELAEAANTRVAVSLSDPSMVEFFGDNLRNMLGNGIDQLFCNEEEALTFCGTDRIDIATNELTDIARHVNITLGAAGSLCASGHERHQVEGYPAQAIDTVGAGDIYAGSVLYGLSHDMSAKDAARFGNFAAAHLVERVGPRLQTVAEYQELLRAFPR